MFKKLVQKPITIEPAFYERDSEILGVFPIRDSNSKILLPKYPENLYQVDGKQVVEFRILAINTKDETVISDLPFREGLKRLSNKIVKEKNSQIVINPIGQLELYTLFAE